jgi:hypothetical protein
MADYDKTEDVEELRDLNAELTASLDRCRSLLLDCRSKLAANANEPDPDADAESETSDGEAAG